MNQAISSTSSTANYEGDDLAYLDRLNEKRKQDEPYYHSSAPPALPSKK
jgi:hypothetical protein